MTVIPSLKVTAVVACMKHGSMPAGWEGLKITAEDGDIEGQYLPRESSLTLAAAYNEAAFRKLKKVAISRHGWSTRSRGTRKQPLRSSTLMRFTSVLLLGAGAREGRESST